MPTALEAIVLWIILWAIIAFFTDNGFSLAIIINLYAIGAIILGFFAGIGIKLFNMIV